MSDRQILILLRISPTGPVGQWVCKNCLNKFPEQVVICRRSIQITDANKAWPEITCNGSNPENPFWTPRECHGLKVSLSNAIRCFYCGFYFCEDCAAKHFGKTKSEYEQMKNRTLAKVRSVFAPTSVPVRRLGILNPGLLRFGGRPITQVRKDSKSHHWQ
jgi:hypothetical protein